MSSFPNLLGMLVADNLINDVPSEACAPVLSAVIRDLKRYQSLRHDATGQRKVPLGYGAATTGSLDERVLRYLSSSQDGRIDFWTVSLADGPDAAVDTNKHTVFLLPMG